MSVATVRVGETPSTSLCTHWGFLVAVAPRPAGVNTVGDEKAEELDEDEDADARS